MHCRVGTGESGLVLSEEGNPAGLSSCSGGLRKRKRCRDPWCSPRGNPACRGLLGVRPREVSVPGARSLGQRLGSLAPLVSCCLPMASSLCVRESVSPAAVAASGVRGC